MHPNVVTRQNGAPKVNKREHYAIAEEKSRGKENNTKKGRRNKLIKMKGGGRRKEKTKKQGRKRKYRRNKSIRGRK